MELAYKNLNYPDSTLKQVIVGCIGQPWLFVLVVMNTRWGFTDPEIMLHVSAIRGRTIDWFCERQQPNSWACCAGLRRSL